MRYISSAKELNQIKPLLNKNYNFDGKILEFKGEKYKVENRFARFIEKNQSESKDSLKHVIEGKSGETNIVGIDTEGNNIVLYYADGSTKVVEHKPRFLSEKKGDNSIVLKGNQPLKYLNVYDSREEWKDRHSYVKYLRKIKTYAIYDHIEEYMMYNGVTMFKGLKLEDVVVLSFDIETSGLTQDNTSKVFLITNTFRKNGKIEKKHFRVDHYENDIEMIKDWCDWVVEIDPQIITGHNIFGYDLSYLRHCYRGELPIGKFGKDTVTMEKTRKKRVDGNTDWEYYPTEAPGRTIVDGIFLAVMYDIGRNFPSWGLKPIAEYLGVVKSDRQFYDAGKIRDNWDDPIEREKIVDYGIHDSDDSLALFDIMVPAFFYLSQYISIPLQTMLCGASGKWINSLLVRAYLQEGYSIPNPSESRIKVSGGISFGAPGIHKNAFKIDVASLYPSIIRSFNMFDEQKDPMGYYKKITDYFTEMRLENKRKFAQTNDTYYDNIQAAQKVAINSIYGMCGTSGLNFNNFELADKITGIGRQIIHKTIYWATGKDTTHWFEDYEVEKDFKYDGILDEQHPISIKTHNFAITGCDTDSIAFKKKDESFITPEERSKLIDEINEIMHKGLTYEDDGYYDVFMVLKAKNYCLLEEGKDKIKKKGSSITDSKKEPVLQQMLDQCIEELMRGDRDLVKITQSYIDLTKNITDITDWCVKKTISKKMRTSERKNETKVMDALAGKTVRDGDKLFFFNDIDGEIQEVKKGELVFTKMKKKEYEALGLEKNPLTELCEHSDRTICEHCNPHLLKPKMVPNRILRLREDFTGSYDVEHYKDRVLKTLNILSTVTDFDKIKDNLDLT